LSFDNLFGFHKFLLLESLYGGVLTTNLQLKLLEENEIEKNIEKMVVQ